MNDSPPRGTSWRVWALVSVTVALLSGPVIPRVIDHLEARTTQTAGASLPVSTRLLKVSELQGLDSWHLTLLRNEIYARRGRRFEDRALQSYFEEQPWYAGEYAPDQFRDEWLTPVERSNAKLIHDYQLRIR